MSKNEDIADLFQEHRDELGFVNRAQVREKTTYTVQRDGDVVGAALCNHCVRKPQTTLYDIAVDESHRREGIASELLDDIVSDTPHSLIVAKCPVDLAAMHFYRETGWTLDDVVEGKSRSLAVWHKAVTK